MNKRKVWWVTLGSKETVSEEKTNKYNTDDVRCTLFLGLEIK